MAQKSSDRRRQADLERGRDAAHRTRLFARDAGLELIGRTTRWLAAGAVGVTGAISLYAAHSFRPHHPAAAPALSSRAASPTSTSQSPADQSGLATAPTPPVAAAPSAAPAVVSGGS